MSCPRRAAACAARRELPGPPGRGGDAAAAPGSPPGRVCGAGRPGRLAGRAPPMNHSRQRGGAVQAHTIAVIGGAGIGPELVDAALAVLEAVPRSRDLRFEYVEIDAGADTFRRTGKVLAESDVELMRSGVDATLKGPVGLPDVRLPDGTEAGLLGGVLRTGLDLYANVRPVLLLPGVSSVLAGRAPGELDYVIVRENTEGLSASRGTGV